MNTFSESSSSLEKGKRKPGMDTWRYTALKTVTRCMNTNSHRILLSFTFFLRIWMPFCWLAFRLLC